jgi:hypothetical protein
MNGPPPPQCNRHIHDGRWARRGSFWSNRWLSTASGAGSSARRAGGTAVISGTTDDAVDGGRARCRKSQTARSAGAPGPRVPVARGTPYVSPGSITGRKASIESGSGAGWSIEAPSSSSSAATPMDSGSKISAACFSYKTSRRCCICCCWSAAAALLSALLGSASSTGRRRWETLSLQSSLHK